MKISKDEADKILRNHKALAKEIESLSVKHRKTMQKLTEAIDYYNGDERFEECGSQKVLSATQQNYLEFMLSMQKQYSLVSDLFGALPSYRIKGDDDERAVVEKGSLVKAVASEDTVYVRLPRLPVRYYRRSRLFIGDVRREMKVLHEDEKTPKYNSKLIRVFNVFATDFPDRMIGDNDNYDIKAITDVIVDYIPGGDFGLDCSFYLDSVKSDDIEAGTYIIISPSHKGVMPSDEVINELKKQFPR